MEIVRKTWNKFQPVRLPAAACLIAAALILAACEGQTTPTSLPTRTQMPSIDTTEESTVEADVSDIDVGTRHAVSLQDNPTPTTESALTGPTLPAPPTFTPTVTLVPTETRFFPTSSIRQRMTLPPSWTPTPTPTITATPTVTRTPTATRTPTITPTRSAKDVCSEFVASFYLETGRVYELSDSVEYVLGISEPDTEIVFEVFDADSERIERVSQPGGTVYLGELPLNSILTAGGTYTWTISVESPLYGRICETDYEITVREPTLLERFFSTISTAQAPAPATETPILLATPALPEATPTVGLFVPPEIQATFDALLTPQGQDEGEEDE